MMNENVLVLFSTDKNETNLSKDTIIKETVTMSCSLELFDFAV
jgi:hypothetical protein